MTNGASNEPRPSIRYPNIRRNYCVAGIVAYYIVERYNTYPKIESRRADSSTAAEIGQAESLPMMNLLFALIVWFGQTAVPPVFEVASIKEARPPSSIENIQAGQFHIGAVSYWDEHQRIPCRLRIHVACRLDPIRLPRQTVSTVGTELDERNPMGYFGQDSGRSACGSRSRDDAEPFGGAVQTVDTSGEP